MEFNEYRDFTEETAVYPEQIGLFYTLLGLDGEVGELNEKVKKGIRDDLPETVVEEYANENLLLVLTEELQNNPQRDVAGELGDILWYWTRVCEELGYDPNEIAAENVAKLTDRKKRDVLHGSGDNR